MTTKGRQRESVVVKKQGKEVVKKQDKEKEKEKFFQDSDDAMEWSSEEDDDGEEEEDEDEDLDSEDEEQEFEEQEFVDSEEGEEAFDDEDAEFVEQDSDDDEEEEEDDSMDESLPESTDEAMDSADESSSALKEKDLLVPSLVAPASNPLLKFFWKLSDADKSVRLAAVADLISHLQVSQNAFSPQPHQEAFEAAKEKVFSLYDGGALKASCCADLTYTVKRLIKGLASGRDEARFGFMLALLAVYHAFSAQLAEHAEVLLSWSFKLSTAESLGGSLKKREERLLLVARLFALGALFRTPALVAHLSEASLRRAIDAACSLAKKKSFLRESALEVLLALFKCEGLPAELAAYAFRRLGSQEALMCEAFAFACSVDGCLKELSSGTTESESPLLPLPQFMTEFKCVDCLLCAKNVAPILDILAEVPCFEGRLHWLWKLIARAACADDAFMSKNAFISTVIEGMLLSHAGTAISKRWTGFLLIRELIALDPLEWMPLVFTPTTARLIRGALGLLSLKNGASAGEAPGKEVAAFNRAVKSFMAELIEAAKDEKEAASKQRAMLLITTLGRIPSGLPGKSLLEACSEDASITDKLYSQLSLENVNGIISQLKEQILMTSSASAFVAQFDKLAGLLKVDRLFKMTGAEEWIQGVLDVFIGWLIDGSLPVEHADALKAKLMSILSELQDSRRQLASGSWIDRVSAAFEVAAVKEESDAPTKDALNQLSACAAASASLKPERLARAHAQLCSFLKLMVFLDPVDAVPCCAELMAVSGASSKKSKKSKPVEIDTAALVQVILDALLTFLAKPSQFCRRVCDEVFKSLVPVIQSASQFDALFTILKSGRVEDFMDVEEDEEAAFEDEDEIEDESGLALDSAISSAVNDAEEQSSSDESDLNDEQMEAFDAKLAEIFREKKKLALTSGNSSKRYAREKRDLVQMKGKVLELLSVAFRSGDLSLTVRLEAIEALLSVVAANVSLAAGGKTNNKATSAAAQEQVKLLERLESFITDIHARSIRPAGEAEAVLARDLSVRVMTAIAQGTLLAKEQEVGVSVLMRAASCVWFCVKVVRSCKATAEANELAMKAAFNEVVKTALSATEEANWRVLRGFVITWAAGDLSFVLPGLVVNANALNCLIKNASGLRIYQRRQLLEMLTAAVKRAASFGLKEAACSVLTVLSTAFSELYLSSGADLSALKVESLREDLKFIQMAAKKHAELDAQAGKEAWQAVTSGVPRVMEAHVMASADQKASAVKSFLGQLKQIK